MANVVEHENKFLLPNPLAPALTGWLAGRCRPDPDFAAGRIFSVYFDTPELRLLREKEASDLFKTKVRLRWYGDFAGGASGSAVFLEVKRREGGTRQKWRMRLESAGIDWPQLTLDAPRFLEINHHLRVAGQHPGELLAPVCRLVYDRRRFIEPLSGCRLSVDSDIRAAVARGRAILGGQALAMPQAVFEVKGPTADLPLALRPVMRLGLRRGSFSKYAAATAWITGGAR